MINDLKASSDLPHPQRSPLITTFEIYSDMPRPYGIPDQGDGDQDEEEKESEARDEKDLEVDQQIDDYD